MTLIAVPRYQGAWAILECGHSRSISPCAYAEVGNGLWCEQCFDRDQRHISVYPEILFIGGQA